MLTASNARKVPVPRRLSRPWCRDFPGISVNVLQHRQRFASEEGVAYPEHEADETPFVIDHNFRLPPGFRIRKTSVMALAVSGE